ncbi:unnamed protein product [Phytomonas sp. Hart1]|nr:unnamed protein product [Phytomonas sp. Hart1]|eukprot:CCW70394.1 unnamed protein product [Phytomonas sp. isolate Hart1]
MTTSLIETSCVFWSLNSTTTSEDLFWWNKTFSVSIWENTLQVIKSKHANPITDTDVWEKYIEFQINNVFKICPVCRCPEGNEDMKICCNCGDAVHVECSVDPTPSQIASKPANIKFSKFMRACFQCYEKDPHLGASSRPNELDDLRRITKRVLTLKNELPPSVYEEVLQIAQKAHPTPNSSELMTQLKCVVQSVYQSKCSLSFLTKMNISSKCGGIGVIAAQDIPQFSIVGVYPGYIDTLSGEQAKLGRPYPKYALMELNCADYHNKVFIEFEETFTPFINEPNETETSNCAWIQETNQMKGRLSIITVKKINKGEELLIGYGPIYARNYPYRYDAYAFHPVEGYTNPYCYVLWHWPTLQKDDAVFMSYVGYLADSDRYVDWDSIANS